MVKKVRAKVFVAAMVMMGFLIMIGITSATIHSGSGVVAESKCFNFGTGNICWSIANEERGYFYGSYWSTPTVYFADKIEDYWWSYDSYEGVQHIWEFTDASDHEWFTQHCITFAEETSSYYTGILLIQQGGLYGAIKPKSIHNGDLGPEDYVLEYDWWYDDTGGSDFSSPVVMSAIVDIDPDTLNLQSKGKWITAYIELPEGYDVSNIDVGTVMLNDLVSAEPHPTEIGDYDDDGIADLMVKFDRSAVQEILEVGEGVEITVTGELTDGMPFEGSDTIRVIDEG